MDIVLELTCNTSSKLYAELLSHQKAYTRRIKIFGVTINGDIGADGGPGLWLALRTFLGKHQEWTVISIDPSDTGCVLISRVETDKPELPSRSSQIWKYATVKLGEFWRGRKLVPLEVAEARLDQCWVCPYRNNNRCTRCGCYLDVIPNDSIIDAGAPGAAWRAGEKCPIGRWHKHAG